MNRKDILSFGDTERCFIEYVLHTILYYNLELLYGKLFFTKI